MFYLTDTGRRWDGDRISVRDKVKKTEVRGRRSGRDRGQRTEEGIRWCVSQSFVILLPCTGEEKAT